VLDWQRESTRIDLKLGRAGGVAAPGLESQYNYCLASLALAMLRLDAALNEGL
jgi:hypothetical protein